MNPSLAIRDSLPTHIADLNAEKAKLIARVLQINAELAFAQTQLELAPDP